MKLNKRFSIYKHKKVLVTGHNGFVGSWLTASLLKLKSQVFGISLKNKNNGFKYIVDKNDPNLTEIQQNINDFKKINSIIKKLKPDFIFHLAAQPIVNEGYKEPLETIKTNILGTSNILESVKQNKIKNCIIITSDKCYLNKENKKFFNEDSELGGDDIYSASKACAEIMTRSFFLSFKNKYTSLDTVRAGNIVGGGDFGDKRLLPDIFKSIYNKKTLQIRSPQSIRPWQNILDVINAYLLLPIYQKKRSYKFDFWNVGPSRKDSTLRVIDIIIKLKKNNKKLKFFKKKGKFKESHYLLLNNNKIKSIGWKNKNSIDNTLEQTAKWYELYYKLKIDELKKFTQDLIEKNLC
jgi:CDP-glucose 4,6-dehydratase